MSILLLSCRSTPDAGAPGGPDGEGGTPAAAPNLTSNRRLQQTQAQVDEVRQLLCIHNTRLFKWTFKAKSLILSPK